jgi:hypothetical protein
MGVLKFSKLGLVLAAVPRKRVMEPSLAQADGASEISGVLFTEDSGGYFTFAIESLPPFVSYHALCGFHGQLGLLDIASRCVTVLPTHR